MSLCESMFLDFIASTTTALWGEGVCEKRQPFAEQQAKKKEKEKKNHFWSKQTVAAVAISIRFSTWSQPQGCCLSE